jgi:hypothetical protein
MVITVLGLFLENATRLYNGFDYPNKQGEMVTKITATVLLLFGTAVVGLAGPPGFGPSPVPEIDPGSAMSGLLLLSAALVMIRGRRKA